MCGPQHKRKTLFRHSDFDMCHKVIFCASICAKGKTKILKLNLANHQNMKIAIEWECWRRSAAKKFIKFVTSIKQKFL